MDTHGAYTELLLRHRSKVWSLCWRYARGDWERCRDLVQEVSAALWQHFGLLRPNAHPLEERAWVILYTRRTLDHLHRGKRPELEPLTIDLAEQIAAPNDSESLVANDLVASLDEPDSTIVRLRLDGYSAAEIAEKTGLSRDAVYQRLHRTIQRLRTLYENER